MADYQLFGMEPSGHHLTNILLHSANVLLLFILLTRMTGALWRSCFVAVLFAIHPLHVESVAWVAERKDVLSTLFWMISLYFYIEYSRLAGRSRYLAALTAFALGLMAKPMLVTLPCVMLLLDCWPLCRLQPEQDLQPSSVRLGHLIVEKIPFFILSAVSSAVTLYAQQKSIAHLDTLDFPHRVANALVAYSSYIGKTLWPHDLAVFYPLPLLYGHSFSILTVVACGLLILCITILCVKGIKSHPYLIVGWLWFLGTLTPVIGLIQVGGQVMADRYMYIPAIGLFIIVAWGISELADKHPGSRTILIAAAVTVLTALAIVTNIQLGYWRNGITLFEHTLNVTPPNYTAHAALGKTFLKQGEDFKALSHFNEALRLNPALANVHYSIGTIYNRQRNFDLAIHHYSQELLIQPDSLEARNTIQMTQRLKDLMEQ
ncbi:MAG: hypothetical protein A2076_06375 [Geobacteraceae bacterium GWC2_53_11]|nr:MAG: hypothetical protein A2076_06375 [Geobacteraceae bacterium GWC2_53_11]